MEKSKNLWDITHKPSTKTKLKILRKCFDVWLTIWNKQDWIANEWYIMDLFAGRGKYIDNKKVVSGSPLIFLEAILTKKDELKKRNREITLFLVEKNETNFNSLRKNVDEFLKNNNNLTDGLLKIKYFKDDCNKIIDKIISEINNTNQNPLFTLIDPTGLQIKKTTIEKIVKLKNPKDILFNYILEGVRRTSGIAKKSHYGRKLNIKELKTLQTLQDFIGEDIDVISADDKEILERYVDIFTSKNLNVIGYDMKYPDRNDILYYLLFAVKNLKVANIVKDIYAKQKEEVYGTTLFGGKEFYIEKIFSVISSLVEINRKSLLYKTKVEYGDWTINHIIGCMHGCKFPCYAMMMAKKFGWVKDYEDWRKPRIAKNYLELLEKEIPKYKNQIDFVHLCFMSDPFMYNLERKTLIVPIKEMTLEIIEKFNKEGIRVTTLTKGIYPDEILDEKRFLKENEYGITLVSLNEDFKIRFEPFSAPYKERIESLKKLAEKGLNTWVSMEPYPTPELDETAENIEKILEKISFVKKIIFGKLNYRRLIEANYNCGQVWKNSKDFYREMVQRLINFCKKNNIKYHVKYGTPLSKSNTVNIFKE